VHFDVSTSGKVGHRPCLAALAECDDGNGHFSLLVPFVLVPACVVMKTSLRVRC